MSRRSLTVWAAAVIAVLGLAVGAVVLRPLVFPGPHTLVAAAWLPVSDSRGPASLSEGLDNGLTEVSPTLATLTADGGLDVKEPTPEVRQLLDRPGVKVIPAVQNYLDGSWQGDMVARLLSDPARADAHREALVQAAVDNGWDGIDIDYESLPATAGPVFTDFLTALRDDLHARDLELTVAIPARTGDQDPSGLAYSYQLIGEVVDQVRVMAYDHSWSGGDAGPVAPLDWVKAVVTYSSQRVPKEKLMLGVATYGYDWVGEKGVSLQATNATELATRMGVTPQWHEGAASWTFSYEQDGQQHTVWYEDARSLAAKQQVALDEGIRGVAIWSLGGEDSELWTSVAVATRGSSS